jgi:hypothetical protein
MLTKFYNSNRTLKAISWIALLIGIVVTAGLGVFFAAAAAFFGICCDRSTSEVNFRRGTVSVLIVCALAPLALVFLGKPEITELFPGAAVIGFIMSTLGGFFPAALAKT